MKGSLVTNLVLGGVLLVLTLFLGLQYNWLRQASEAERERLQKRVEADTKNFAGDFNRELQSAFFSFQTEPSSWENSNWSEFGQRYDYWRSKTPYPELIREFIYFPNGGGPPLRYDPVNHRFVEAAASPELGELRSKIEAEASPRSFLEDVDALVMPIFREANRVDHMVFRRSSETVTTAALMPERTGHLAIMLDRSVITGRILPDLVAKHFPEGNFRVSVADRTGAAVYQPAGEAANPDAKAGLMSLAPDNLLLLSSNGMWSQMMTERKSDVRVSERVESKTFTHSESTPEGTKTDTFTVELKPRTPDGGPVKARTSVFASTANGTDPWMLNVLHTSGSIDAFISGEFTKNFLIGLGVYLLLVGAIIAIVLSALRSKRFAQRQIDFVSSVSHEFRTPLAVIYSASENLADGVAHDREQVARYGGLIKNEGRKLSAMVEQILEFAGARSGKRKYNFVLGDVTEAVRRALEEAEPALKESGFEVESSLTPDLPKTSIDPDAIETVVRNLIQNAVKYSNGSRWIRVATENGGDSIKIVVEDRGIGISDAERKKIFEPFYRGKEVVDAQIHGNGLGLSLVKEIIDVHGGKVGLTSEIGKGSRFVIEVPLV
ncbi:MAG: HAMP domain-containing histidine kinase [Chloracidobacterium sp.]|nr:HAMP domain-containing histidine kinase [Chloracidobacterium sp.]